MRKSVVLFGLLAALPSLAPVHAQVTGGKSQGGIVLRDGAPVYKKSKGDLLIGTLKRGDAVSGWTMLSFGDQVTGMIGGDRLSGGMDSGERWVFDEKDGRVMVVYTVSSDEDNKKRRRAGWMDPADLSQFTFDGSCTKGGSPFLGVNTDSRWNACFLEARDAKLKELQADWAKAGKPQAETRPAEMEKKPE